MKILRNPISKAELFAHVAVLEGDYIKAVVDVKNELLAYDAGMHVDLEQLLLEEGSSQQNLWGINLYNNISDDSWIEFDSMINLRPGQGNRTRGVDDVDIRKRIMAIVHKLIAT